MTLKNWYLRVKMTLKNKTLRVIMTLKILGLREHWWGSVEEWAEIRMGVPGGGWFEVCLYSSVRISARRISARSGLAHTLTQLHVLTFFTEISPP